MDRFDVDEDIKIKFKSRQLQWARFWPILVLRRVNEKL